MTDAELLEAVDIEGAYNPLARAIEEKNWHVAVMRLKATPPTSLKLAHMGVSKTHHTVSADSIVIDPDIETYNTILTELESRLNGCPRN